jgi:hypothetical protein
VIQASQLGELSDAGLRAERFRVGRDRAAAAEQAARRATGRRPSGPERDILGLADGCAVAGVAEGVRPANDLLQPLCTMAKSRGLGPHSGRILAAVTTAYDGKVQMIDSTSVRVHQHAANSKKATRIAVWAARAAG